MRKILIGIVSALLIVLSVSAPVMAQTTEPVTTGTQINFCTFIGPLCQAFGLNQTNIDSADSYATAFLLSRANTLLSLLFVGIIILSVFIIVQAGVKYIQRQGNEKKIGEAQKAIKTVFIGIGVLFVGLAGMILILAFFGGTGLLSSGASIDTILSPNNCATNPSLAGCEGN